MRMPTALRNLDDRVIGSRRGTSAGHGDHDDHGHGHGRDHDHDHDHDGHDSRDGRDRDRHDGDREETVTRVERRPAEKRGNGDGLSSFLSVFWRVCRLVLIALALVLVAAIAFILLPANEDNVIVRNVLSLGETVAGPFKDVFNVDDAERERIYNYALAAVVYFIAASVVGKLPTGRKKAA